MGPWFSCTLLCYPFCALQPVVFSTRAFLLPCTATFPLSWLKPDFRWGFVALVVRELLDMASSRGIPRAAAKLELALHCLHQARGSVPVRSGYLGAEKSGQGISKAWALGQPLLAALGRRESTRSGALAACWVSSSCVRDEPKWLEQGACLSWRCWRRLPQPAPVSICWRSVFSETFWGGLRGNSRKPQQAEAILRCRMSKIPLSGSRIKGSGSKNEGSGANRNV